MNAPENFDEQGLRVPPHSIEMEQSVLGALMLKNDAFDVIMNLRAEHFYRYEHRVIFDAIAKLIVSNRPADVMTVYEALGASGKLDQTGGLKYLNSIVDSTPGAANIARYAQIVIDRAKMRQLICAADEVAAQVFHRNGKTVDELIAFAQEKFEPLSEDRAEGPQFLGPSLTRVVERLDREYHGEEPMAISTGLKDLDFKLGGGVNGGDLIILAGRPSMGKTALAMEIGEHVAIEYGLPVAVFSLEMPTDQLTRRALARHGNLPLQILRNGSRMSDAEWPKLTHAVQIVSELPLAIDDSAGLTLADIASRSRSLKRKHGLKMIIVDYLQLMTGGPDERHDLRIGSYSAGLKALAKQLDVPVIALSQLNRALEQRPNKRPIVADLRDSGAIEQDADTILFLYRDEVYNEDSPDKGVAEINIAKQRNGPTGTAYTAFIHEQARFANLAGGYIPTPRMKPRQSRGFDE